ncbi:flagellar FliJ family protein [Niveispirillum irakense]|uniref:flagellar FliJ family protein n=1 Tax=Niveispirillum irakense TaxID=34011 RepID=UPI0003FCE33D|nr:flagellar FliJ family protein [Niveispirillum irakense]
MKDLKPIIRLNQRSVDERRRHLGELQRVEQKLLEDRAAFEDRVVQERTLAGTDLLLARALPSFLRHAKDRLEQFDRSHALLRVEIAKAEEMVAEAFRELKKFEQVQEQRDLAAKEARRHRETQMFDEVASIRFSRQQDGGGGSE